jgi:hypothetical protein
MKSILIYSLFLSIVAILNTSADSNIKGPSYKVIINSLNELSNQYPLKSEIITYGKTEQGRTLSLIKIFDKSWKGDSARKAVVITGATHGWEYLNIADRLPEWVLSTKTEITNTFLKNGGVIYIVPVFNPDGYDNRRRYNSNEVDLNRDYPLPLLDYKGLTQKENIGFITLLENEIKNHNIKIDLNINYHCCGYKTNAVFLYPWAHTDSPTPEAKRFMQISKGVEAIFDMHNIFSAQWAVELYKRKGTATDYFYSVHKADAFNFEGSWGKENLRFNKHTIMLEFLIEQSLRK